MIQLIREQNPEIQTCSIEKVWNAKPYKTYREITVLIKSDKGFKYCYLSEEKENKKMTCLESENVEEPVMDSERNYKLKNKQVNIHKDEAKNVIEFINS